MSEPPPPPSSSLVPAAAAAVPTAAAGSSSSVGCPYLDTINRSLLDFDSSDHCCSVTLESSHHIYACLVCGKFYRGRGVRTPAYTHAVMESHFVFVHLTHGTFWCLPDNYEILLSSITTNNNVNGSNTNINTHNGPSSTSSTSSLRDIQLALHPTFTIDEVNRLDTNVELSRDLSGRRYLPGFVGLNNLNGTDYLNAVVQALGHVRPLRDFFLLVASQSSTTTTTSTTSTSAADDNIIASGNENGRGAAAVTTTNTTTTNYNYDNFSPLAKSFSLLLRNMWSNHRFKSNVDPHMLVQAVSTSSNKRYHVGKRGTDAGEFLAWLLHQLHVGVCAGATTVTPPPLTTTSTTASSSSTTKKSSSSSSSSSTSKKQKKSSKINGGGSVKKHGAKSVIHETFMGRVEVTTVVRRRKRRGEEAALEMLNGGGLATTTTPDSDLAQNAHVGDDDDDDDRDGSDDEEIMERKRKKRETLHSLANETIVVEEETVTESDFLQLTLDIPEKPLFKDDDGGLVIPQEPLVNVLRKFDGVSFSDVLAMQQHQPLPTAERNDTGGTVVSRKRRYRLKKLPNYLILHLNRFKRNGFFVEKNPTIVMFPVKNFDLSSYVFPEGGRDKVPTEDEVRGMSTKELKNLLVKYGRADLAIDAIEKNDLLQNCLDFISTSLPNLLADKYDLVANITHDIPIEVGREGKQRNPLEEGSYRCHVQHKATGQWYEIQDLNVRETMPQLIGVSESYLLIFERKGAAAFSKV